VAVAALARRVAILVVTIHLDIPKVATAEVVLNGPQALALITLVAAVAVLGNPHHWPVLVGLAAAVQVRGGQVMQQQEPLIQAVVVVAPEEMQLPVHRALVVLGSLLFGILILMRQLLPPQARQQ